MADYAKYFKDKKVTVMGLGLLGRALNDVKFLSHNGAELIVTDLKTREQLKESLDELKDFKNITYVLGEHRLEDFRARDFILKNAGVPLDSPFIREARDQKIPVEMDESLFVKLAPPVKIIGVTGTRGKSTTTALIYEILKSACKDLPQKVYLAGNVRGVATLPLLDVIKAGDIVVMELSSWQLQGFAEARMSPGIAVFTNFMDDHLNYYKGNVETYFEDKAAIFKYQTSKDLLIVGEDVAPLIRKKYGKAVKSHMIVPEITSVPGQWNIQLKGRHNLENIALALAVAREMKITDDVSKNAIEKFRGVEGRLQHVRTFNDIEIYNDTTATTPDATLAALRALGTNKNVVLIMGGADKMLDMSSLILNLPQYVSSVILLAGSGSLMIQQQILRLKNVRVEQADTLEIALQKALGCAGKGDIVLFSPAFASFGMFKNEFDRGERFLKLVEGLK